MLLNANIHDFGYSTVEFNRVGLSCVESTNQSMQIQIGLYSSVSGK